LTGASSNSLHSNLLCRYPGELGKTEELAGRSKDARMVDPSSKVDGVKLEYRDEFGRKLTQKEAFRQICYRFHGYGPGKKAKEKRLKVRSAASHFIIFTEFHLFALLCLGLYSYSVVTFCTIT
jgi:SART-1 family